MPRLKERMKILHEPSTHEIFMCLSHMPKWSEILFSHGVEKPYKPFLKWLLEAKFFSDREEKMTVKKLSSDFKADASKVTKWLRQIYDDIIDLNFEKPDLFCINEEIKVLLHMKAFDNYCSLFVSLPALPREFESFRFSFARGKLGIDYFWVKKIEYLIEDDKTYITVWLQDGFVNRYREFALDKAIFQGWISFRDRYEKYDGEIDSELRNLYRT